MTIHGIDCQCSRCEDRANAEFLQSSSPQPTSTLKNPISPNQLFDHAGKLAVLHSLAESLLSRIGTLASEFSRLAQMEIRGHTDGLQDTTDTPTPKPSLASIALANTDLPLVRTSPASIQKGAKAAPTTVESQAQYSSADLDRWLQGSAPLMAKLLNSGKHTK